MKNETALYVMRALRYLVKMIVIITLAILFLRLFGLFDESAGNIGYILLRTTNGNILLALLLVLTVTYPKLYFTRLQIGDPSYDMSDLDRAMQSLGYEPSVRQQNVTVYRSKVMLNRLLMHFDDKVYAGSTPEGFTVEGPKKIVLRIEAYLHHQENKEI